MQLLLTIITEFSNTEKEISEERKGQIHKLFAQYFFSCLQIGFHRPCPHR